MFAYARGKAALGLVFFAAVLVYRPGAVQAQETPEALIRQGVELRRQGKDAVAQGYFSRAYSLAHTPRAAAQLGLVEQALGYFLDAEMHLSEALDNADAWVDQKRKILEESRKKVRSHLARVDVHGIPRGGTVRVGDRAAAPLADDGAVWVPPGSITLTFAAPELVTSSKDVSASAGQTISLDVELKPVRHVREAAAADTTPKPAVAPVEPPAKVAAARRPEPTARPPQDEARRDVDAGDGGKHTARVAGVVVASVGAALVAGGVVVYLAGSSKLDAINRDAAAGSAYNPANGNYKTLGSLGMGLAIAGGAAIAAGAVLYLVNRETGADASATRVSLGYLPAGGGAVQLEGRF